MKAHKSKNQKALLADRAVPDIAPDLLHLAAPRDVFAGLEVIVQDCVIENLALDGLSPDSIHFENCILHRVSFTRSKLFGLKLKDVRFTECDFANAEVPALKALRVEFLNCRLTGLRATEAECQHFLISGGDASFSQLRFGAFKTAEFHSCNFAEADLQSSDLRDAILKGCNFKNAEMTGARLEGADLRGSDVEGLIATAEDLRGAIVDPAQALVLAEIMGLKIR